MTLLTKQANAVDTTEGLERLRALTALRGLVDLITTGTVADCREHGYSWHAIGTELGISKQAAWEYYGSTDRHEYQSGSDT